MSNPMLEGFAQADLTVAGNLPQKSTTTWNYTTYGHFRTYPLSGTDVYDGPVSVSTNTDPNGPRVELVVPVFDMMGNIISTSPYNTNITLGVCSPFLLNVYVNDSMVPATLMPYLGAPVHFTIASPDDAAYHAHGMYMLPGDDWAETMTAMSTVMMETQTEMMDNMMIDPNVNVTLNAMMMLGLEMNMSLDCQLDMGTAMMNMGMTSMNLYFGPPTFAGSLVATFDWPQDSRQWRLWAYLKIMMADGTERLIVPSFDIYVDPTPFPTSMGMSSTSMGMTSGAAVIAPFLLLALLCVVAFL